MACEQKVRCEHAREVSTVTRSVKAGVEGFGPCRS